jgi:hypothetical protein
MIKTIKFINKSSTERLFYFDNFDAHLPFLSTYDKQEKFNITFLLLSNGETK